MWSTRSGSSSVNRLSVKPISFAPVVEAMVTKKRQLASYIAPSYNAQPYEDFVTSPDAAKRSRTAEAEAGGKRPTAQAAFTHLHEVAGRLRDQAGAASEHFAAAGTAARHRIAISTAQAYGTAQAAASSAQAAASTAMRIADYEVDALVDPFAQAKPDSDSRPCLTALRPTPHLRPALRPASQDPPVPASM